MSNLKKIVLFQGGLGNQLFQFAWGEYLRVEMGCEVYFDGSTLRAMNAHGGITLSDLFDFSTKETSESCVFFQMGILPKVVRGLTRVLKIDRLGNYLLYDYNAFLDFHRAKSASSAKFHFGYFQYVQSALTVREYLKSSIKEKYQDFIIQGVKKFSDSVGIHVRRGDFLASHDVRHKVMDADYYRKAIDKFEGRKFSIFTDDEAWCRDVFDGLNFEICSVLGTEVKPAISDFLSLMCCRDYIIGTSTFAWWAAFLSFSDNITIYMPGANLPFQESISNEMIGWSAIIAK